MRDQGFICFKDFNTSALRRLRLSIFISTVYVMFLLTILFTVSPSYAEGPKTFTDADLENYKADPIVDEETVSRMEADLNSYEKKRDADFLLDRERSEKRRAEEVKRSALQKQKQDAAVSRAPVASQGGSGSRSGVTYFSSPGSKRRT